MEVAPPAHLSTLSNPILPAGARAEKEKPRKNECKDKPEIRWRGGVPLVPGAPFALPEGFVESDICVKFLDLVPEYVFFELTPKILAMKARAKGAAGLSPRDFVCPCPIDPGDGLPRCLGEKEGCRFSGRIGDPAAARPHLQDNLRMKIAAETIAEEMSAFYQADDAGRRRIVQRMAQAAARRRRRAAQAGSHDATRAIEDPPEANG